MVLQVTGTVGPQAGFYRDVSHSLPVSFSECAGTRAGLEPHWLELSLTLWEQKPPGVMKSQEQRVRACCHL